MPYTVKWLVPHKVIFQTLDGHIDADTARSAMTDARDLIDTSDEPLVHIISDMSNNTHMPRKLNEARQIMDVLLSHPKMGWVIIYGQNRVITFVASLVVQIFSTRFRAVNSKEDAFKFLETTYTDMSDLATFHANLEKTN